MCSCEWISKHKKFNWWIRTWKVSYNLDTWGPENSFDNTRGYQPNRAPCDGSISEQNKWSCSRSHKYFASCTSGFRYKLKHVFSGCKSKVLRNRFPRCHCGFLSNTSPSRGDLTSALPNEAERRLWNILINTTGAIS